MNLADLQSVLTESDPAAVLVSARVLERVVQEECNFRGIQWVVPHAECYVADRHVLFRHVEQDDLTLETHQLLPSRVILLARPKPEELSSRDKEPILLRYWRRLFHANVHLVLEDRSRQGLLSDSVIRSRIDEIGNSEFEEIRAVLLRDAYLTKEDDDREVYIEFAAVYLELRHFAPQLLPVFFPALRDVQKIENLIALDLDAESLCKRTRLAEAPAPEAKSQDQEYESHEYYWKLVRSAERASGSGNKIKAAIIRTRAARIAPAAHSPITSAAAEDDLKEITHRLQDPLQLSDDRAVELLTDLKKLLDKADQGASPVESSILYELQLICLVNEEKIFALGPVEWMLTLGKRPILRPLPSQRLVRIIRHLRTVLGQLTFARLSDTDRGHLTDLLQWALEHAEERMRNQFRPILIAVMEDVGLQPTNPPERTAVNKMIEEFLDCILEAGFFSFGDLRDIISRNQLKMPDLGQPSDFIHGDSLLRLDRRLATVLDGVYRPSEFYMRWLERLTALNFGTKFGRFLTLFITIPIGGAFLLYLGVKYIIDHLPNLAHSSGWAMDGTMRGPGGEVAHGPMPWESFNHIDWTIIGVTAVFLIGLLHSRWVRRKTVRAWWLGLSVMRKVFIDFPVWVVMVPSLRQMAKSWPAQLTYWYVFKPGLLCLVIFWFFPALVQSPLRVGVVFVAATLFLNTGMGLTLSQSFYQAVLDLVHLIRSGLLASLYTMVITISKQIRHLTEYILYRVDELLRFRADESKLTFLVRIVLSTIWYPVSFVGRFYVIVLIEPMINPLKLPISTIAGKIFFPATLPIFYELLYPQGTLSFGEYIVWVLVWIHWGLFPDVFGFLVWEMKENWSLYKANRSRNLKPVVIGSHGETMLGMLQTGFHSGTIPKIYAKLRRAEQEALATGNYRDVRAYHKTMREVQMRIQRCVTRELISLVHQSAHWEHRPLKAGEVRLASNRIDVELLNDDFPHQPLQLVWEWRSRWLIASIRNPGWLERLSGESYWAFLAGLTCLYKLLGVELVQEQIQYALPDGAASYDITPTALIVWLDQRYGRSVIYDLKSDRRELRPVTPDGIPALGCPTLSAKQVIFARLDVKWNQIVHVWNKQGEAYANLVQARIYCESESVLEEPRDPSEEDTAIIRTGRALRLGEEIGWESSGDAASAS